MTDLVHAGLLLLCLGALALALRSYRDVLRLRVEVLGIKADRPNHTAAERHAVALALAREAVAYVDQLVSARAKDDVEQARQKPGHKPAPWARVDRWDRAREYARLQIAAHGYDFDKAQLSALDETIEASLGLARSKA